MQLLAHAHRHLYTHTHGHMLLESFGQWLYSIISESHYSWPVLQPYCTSSGLAQGQAVDQCRTEDTLTFAAFKARIQNYVHCAK